MGGCCSYRLCGRTRSRTSAWLISLSVYEWGAISSPFFSHHITTHMRKNTSNKTGRGIVFSKMPKPSTWRNRIVVGCMWFLFSLGMFALSPTVIGYAQLTIPDLHPRLIERPWAPAPKYTKREEFCLTQAVYYEAGTQSRKGKEAVALVILNRVAHGHYPQTICGVVHQSIVVGEKRICQFSYHCLTHYKPNAHLWAESKLIAQKSLKNIFNRDILLLLGQAQYFHAVYVNPEWAKEKQRVAKIGDHVFYRERGVQF